MDQVLDLLHQYLEIMAKPFADPTRPIDLTGDLIQESCFRAWQKLDQFEGGESDEETFAMFRAWLGQIVRRIGMNLVRDRKRRRRIPFRKSVSPRSAVPGQSRIETALVRFKDRTDRAILWLHLFNSMTLAKISERLEMDYARILDRYRRAVCILQWDLKKFL